MIEESQNIVEVTERHEGDVRSSRESFQRAVSEGRIVVRSHATERAQLAVAQERAPPRVVTTSAVIPEAAAAEVQPIETMPPPKDPETTWRYTRLAITAGLVVLLFVVWFWQKRVGR